MSDDDYFTKLEAMDPDVRAIEAQCWDYTGRPITEQPIAVALCLLLDSIVTPAEFRVKGRQITDGMKEMTDADFDVIYYTYERGMLRVKRELEKEFA
jgi:hypothetical protein